MKIKNNTSQFLLMVDGQTLKPYETLMINYSDKEVKEQVDELSNKGLITICG